MIDIRYGFVDFFVSLAQWLSNTFQSIAWVIVSIPKFTSSITAIFAYCPTRLLVFLEVSLALTVLFAVIKLIK